MSSWDLIYLGDVRPLEFPHISNKPTQQDFELSLFSKVLIVFNVFCCPDVDLPCSFVSLKGLKNERVQGNCEKAAEVLPSLWCGTLFLLSIRLACRLGELDPEVIAVGFFSFSFSLVS